MAVTRDTARSSDAARSSASLRELARLATLAASSHNTQPWTIGLGERSLTIFPDLTRRCPVVDPDDHHLFVSLGCATENVVTGALPLGLHANAECRDDRIEIALEATAPARSELAAAIPDRQCSRSIYDGRALPAAELGLLERAATGDGVHAVFLTTRPQVETVLDYVARGNAEQIGNPAFVRELETWIRFTDADAARTGDGLFAPSTGNPAVPRWLGRLFLRTLLTPRAENDKCAAQLRSSAGVAVFVSDRDDTRHWMEVGRCYERFALQATALGIRTAFLNQPVEVVPLRAQFGAWLNVGRGRPDLVVRFGRGPDMPRSRRRPLEAVLT